MVSGRNEIFSLSGVLFHLVIAGDVICHFSNGKSPVLGLSSPVCRSRRYENTVQAVRRSASVETKNFNAISTFERWVIVYQSPVSFGTSDTWWKAGSFNNAVSTIEVIKWCLK
jgi:hypothetical protein